MLKIITINFTFGWGFPAGHPLQPLILTSQVRNKTSKYRPPFESDSKFHLCNGQATKQDCLLRNFFDLLLIFKYNTAVNWYVSFMTIKEL